MAFSIAIPFSTRDSVLHLANFSLNADALSGDGGRVYLDASSPRVCIRGPELRGSRGLGYEWLRPQDVFPYYELRSAAQDLRDGSSFDPDEMRRRISAQLDTLREHRVRHVVLGAFGCGAFMNPAAAVARLYKEEINARRADFSVIAFAIYAAGYGPDNFTPFSSAMDDVA